VKLAYSGNGTMTASWDAVADASSYTVTLYDADGASTGLIYQVDKAEGAAAPASTIIMDASSVTAGAVYSIGVKAVVDTVTSEGTVQKSTAMGTSGGIQLKAAKPPVLSFSDNVATGEGNLHTVAINGDGGGFTVSSNEDVSFTVTKDGADFKSGNGRSLDINDLAPGEDTSSMTLQIVAKDSDGDYAVSYVDVNFDTVAPPLILDNYGEYAWMQTDRGTNQMLVTGHTEAGTAVQVWGSELVWDRWEGAWVPSLYLLTSQYAAEDGSFSILAEYSDDPVLGVQAVDAAGNKSDFMNITEIDDPITVSFDKNNNDDSSCTIVNINLANGQAIGELPAVRGSETKLFDGWYTHATGGTQITSSTTFGAVTTIYAHWTDAVNITFVPGTGATSQVLKDTAKKGGAIGKLPDAWRTDGQDMIFLGWFTAASGGTKVTESTVFSGDTSIYAHWVQAVTISFDPGLGSYSSDLMKEDGTIVIEKNSSLAALPTAESRGYAFLGWYIADQYDASDPDVQISYVNTNTVFRNDTLLAAHWKRITADLTVTMNAAVFTDVDIASDPSRLPPSFTTPADMVGAPLITYTGTVSKVVKGKTIQYDYMSTGKPTEPGSYKVYVKCETFECAYIGSKDFTITQTGVESYTITVDASISGGSITAVPASGVEGEIITLTAVPGNGYRLVPGSLSVTYAGGEVTTTQDASNNNVFTFEMPKGNVTITAQFAPADQYKVTVIKDEGAIVTVLMDYSEENGGVTIASGDTVPDGTVLTVLAQTKAGYIKSTPWPEVTYTVTSDLEIEARTEIQTFALNLANAGGEAPVVSIGGTAVTDISAIPYGAQVTVSAGAPVSGNEFIGWYQPNGKQLTAETEYTFSMFSDTSLEARYQQVTGVVTFIANGNVNATVTTTSITAGDFPADPVPYYGFEFDGWDKTVDEINEGLAGGGNVTVTAKFRLLPVSFTVNIFNGERNNPIVLNYTESTIVNASADTVDGKVFAYWELDGAIISYKKQVSFRASENCTLKAVYSTEAVTAMGTATIKTSSYNIDTKKLTSIAYLTVPDGAVIVNAGLYAASPTVPGTKYTDTSAELTAANADYVKSSTLAVGKSADVNYTWNKGGVSQGDVWYLRAYVTYTKDGNTETVYGNRVTVKAGTDYDFAEKGSGVIKSASYNSGTLKGTFVAYLTVPESGVISKAGLVAASAAHFDPNTALLTADNADYVKSSTKAVGTNAEVNYTWNKSNIQPGDVWYVRAYLVYTDENSLEHTVYGDLVEFTAN
jgi:hypothetical protein